MNPNIIIDGESLLFYIGLDSTSPAEYTDSTPEKRKADMDAVNKILKTIIEKSKVPVDFSVTDEEEMSPLMKAALGVNGEASAMMFDYKWDKKHRGANPLYANKEGHTYISFLPVTPRKTTWKYYVEYFTRLQNAETNIDINQKFSIKKSSTAFASMVVKTGVPEFSKQMIKLGMNFIGDDKSFGALTGTIYNKEHFDVVAKNTNLDFEKQINGKKLIDVVEDALNAPATNNKEKIQLNEVKKYIQDRM